jgi:hypothetical protein
VGLLVGLETSTAKASYEESLWQAYVACVSPMLKRIARQMTRSLVADPVVPFGDPARLRVWFDLSEVRCLGEDQDSLAKRLALLFSEGIIKRSQAQMGLSYQADTSADGYFYDLYPGATKSITKSNKREEKQGEDKDNDES